MPHFLELVSAAKSGNLEKIKGLLADSTLSNLLTKNTYLQLKVLFAALSGGVSVFHSLSEYLDASGTPYHIAGDKKKLFELLSQAIKIGDCWILSYLLGRGQPVAPPKVTRSMVLLGRDSDLRKQVAVLVVETNKAEVLNYFLTQAHVFANDASELLDMFSETTAKSLEVLKFFGAWKPSKAEKSELFCHAMKEGKPEIFQYLLGHPEFIKLLQDDQAVSQSCIICSAQNLDSLRYVLANNILVKELMAGDDDGVDESESHVDPDDGPILNDRLKSQVISEVLKLFGSNGIKLLAEKQPDLVAKLKKNKKWQSQAFEVDLTTAAFKYLLDSPEIPEIANSLKDDAEEGNAEVQEAALLAAMRLDGIDNLEYLLKGRPKVLERLLRDNKLQGRMFDILLKGRSVSLKNLDYCLETMKWSENIAALKSIISVIIDSSVWSLETEETLKILIERLHQRGESWHFSENVVTNLLKRGENFVLEGRVVHKEDSSFLEGMLNIEALRNQMASFGDGWILHVAVRLGKIGAIKTLLKLPEVRKRLPARNHLSLRAAVDCLERNFKIEVERKLEREVKEIAEMKNKAMAVLSLLIEAYRKEGIPFPKNITITVEGKKITLKVFMDKSLWAYAGFHSVRTKSEKENLPFPPRLPISSVRLIQEFTGAVPTQSPAKQLLDSLNHLGDLQARVKEGAVKGDPKNEMEIEIQKIVKLLKRDDVGLEDGIPGGGRLRAEIEKALGKDTALSNRLIKLIESERMPITPLKKEGSAMDTSLDSQGGLASKEVAVLDRAETSPSEGLYLSAAASQLKEQASKKGGQKRDRTGEPKTLVSSSEGMADESEGLEREQAVETPVETEAEGTSSYNSKRGKTAQSSEDRSGNRSPRSNSPG